MGKNFSILNEFEEQERQEEMDRGIKAALHKKEQENEVTQKTLEQEITEFKEKVETLRKDLVEKVEPEFRKLLVKYNVEAIRWPQYTPYFMDGDECIFSVDSYSVAILHDDEFLSQDDLDYEDLDIPTQENFEHILNSLETFLESIPSDIMKTMFGDHVEVTITSTGVDTEYYEHD